MEIVLGDEISQKTDSIYEDIAISGWTVVPQVKKKILMKIIIKILSFFTRVSLIF